LAVSWPVLRAMNWFGGIKVASLLTTASLCLFEFMLHRQSGTFREFEAVLLSLQWILLLCLVVWCGTFLFMTFRLDDLPLIALLLVATTAFLISKAASHSAVDALTLLFAVTLGKGARVLIRLRPNGEMLKEGGGILEFRMFLVCMVFLLAFSSGWHLEMTDNYYHGPRWMGLWNNPNDYGLLMSAGLTLAIGLLAGGQKVKVGNQKSEKRNFLRSFAAKSADGDARSLSLRIILLIAVGMLGVGLVFSYSRGACVGAAVGLLYLAKTYRKFKWRYVLPGIFIVAAAAWFFWNSTADTAPWYVKRMDLGRPSAQHRVAAWRGAIEMMRDNPLGVGWNNAESVYEKNYSPPEDGAAAITTNDYLMLGTQLGVPGLVFFVSYVALCFRNRPHLTLTISPPTGSREGIVSAEISSLRVACRAGTLAMLVAFWFDGGLFKLATAAVFWILLELGANLENRRKCDESNHCLVTSTATM
jgi:hypothetical protein